MMVFSETYCQYIAIKAMNISRLIIVRYIIKDITDSNMGRGVILFLFGIKLDCNIIYQIFSSKANKESHNFFIKKNLKGIDLKKKYMSDLTKFYYIILNDAGGATKCLELTKLHWEQSEKLYFFGKQLLLIF